ncbi:MAG: hypothetical protein ACRD4Q_07715 [Candidatus Acidiferrales bacterium]
MRKLPFAIFGLALLCASQALAGATGSELKQPTTVYFYCYGGQPQLGGTATVYFSTVFSRVITNTTLAPTDLGSAFKSYLNKTFGERSNNGAACISSGSMDVAVTDKKKREAEYDGLKWKIVETNWTGAGVQFH